VRPLTTNEGTMRSVRSTLVRGGGALKRRRRWKVRNTR
jgi:hypothetical protein